MRKNEIYETEIIDMNNLGYGIARIDGMAVFVSGGVTGDLLSVKIIKTAKDYAVAIIDKIILPSGKRTESDCPIFDKCGGCSFRHISREYELELKRNFVVNAFHKNRIDADVLPTVTDGNINGYRNKVQYPIDRDGTKGYYARHSHRIIPCDSCLLADPMLEDIASFAAVLIKKYKVPAKHLYLRCGQKTGQVMVCIVSAENGMNGENKFVEEITDRFSRVVSIVWNTQPEDNNVILGKTVRVLYGDDVIEDELCDCRFSISSLSFYQVNRGMAELLYREAHRRAADSNPKSVADLYCGAGTIGITLAKSYPDIKVYGVEIIPEAIENAKKNAEKNGIKSAEFLCADALTADLDNIDCVIVDPPRKGLSSELVNRFCNASPKMKKIVYVSCNPETLARDAAILIKSGYKMSSVTPFDLFPRTGSVECVTDFSI